MKLRIIFVLSFVLISFTFSQAQDKDYVDGSLWNSYTPEQKKSFMEGWKSGVLYQMELVEMLESKAKEGIKNTSGNEKFSAEQFAEAYKLLLRTIALIFFQQGDFEPIIEKLNSFYIDNANKNIYVAHAIKIWQASIDGSSNDYIVKLIQKYRRQDGKISK